MNDIVLSEFDFNDISFSRPDHISKKITLFNVKYKSKKFIIQTPKLITHAPIFHTNNCSGSMKFSIYNSTFCPISKKFLKNIESIDKFIKSKASYFWEKCNRSKNNRKFVSSIYTKPNINPSFYCNIQMYRYQPTISIFDHNKNPQPFNYLIPYSKAYSLIMLESVWVKSGKIGLNWTVLQMKVYLPMYKINECLIRDEEDIENDIINANNLHANNLNANNLNDIINPNANNPNYIIIKDHPKYKRFFDMKRFGIPEIVIITKMKNENLNSDYLSQPNHTIIINTTQIITSSPNFLGQIANKSGILRKTEPVISKDKDKDKDTEHPYKASLEEILMIKSKLKKRLL